MTHWTVERDRISDRFLVVRWANGVGTIEVDCPSQASARGEARRLREAAQPARGAPIAPEDMRYPPGEAGDQLSLLTD